MESASLEEELLSALHIDAPPEQVDLALRVVAATLLGVPSGESAIDSAFLGDEAVSKYHPHDCVGCTILTLILQRPLKRAISSLHFRRSRFCPSSNFTQ